MRILIVDNNMDPSCWGAEDICRLARQKLNAEIVVRRGPHQDLPSGSFDRVILSGSRASCLEPLPWITALDQAIKNWINAKTPLLGICFGHQAIARVLEGRHCLGKSATPEFGWSKIELLAESPLLAGLPSHFYSFSSHYEEVKTLPPGARCLARSPDCAIQAFDVPGSPLFAIQFHPEKSLREAESSFADYRKSKPPRPLLLPEQSKKLYNPLIGEKLFFNFLSD